MGMPATARAHERSYPHQPVGRGAGAGAMIARAMACEPKELIADEPTTALDVTIQTDSRPDRRTEGTGCRDGGALIAHDMGVIARLADRVAVMYARAK